MAKHSDNDDEGIEVQLVAPQKRSGEDVCTVDARATVPYLTGTVDWEKTATSTRLLRTTARLPETR